MVIKDINCVSSISEFDKITIMSLIEFVSDLSNIRYVILFGSRARNTHRKGSDTDILIVTKDELYDNTESFEWNSELNKLNGTNVSLSLISESEWNNPSYEESVNIKSNILKDGIELSWG